MTIFNKLFPDEIEQNDIAFCWSSFSFLLVYFNGWDKQRLTS